MGAVIVILVALVLLGFMGASLFLKRHGESSTTQSGWQRTDEVFRDPSTQRIMRVWVDPADGARHYVEDT
jgi:hypothetical protein